MNCDYLSDVFIKNENYQKVIVVTPFNLLSFNEC